MTMSPDGGDTWIEYGISETPFIPESHIFFGDYTNVAALDGNVYPIWMRMDAGALSIWTALVEIRPSDVPVAPGQRLVLRQNRPNPFNPVTRIEFVVPEAVNGTLKVYDLAGTELQAGDQSVTRKMTLVK